MPFLLPYLFKLSLTLAVLYVFYYLLLRKLTFYNWNRFYLLCYSLLSFIIPFINITPWIRDQPVVTGSFINRINIISRLHVAAVAPAEQKAMQVSCCDVLLLLFASGAAFMLVRLLLQLLSIQSIRRKATLIRTGDIRLYDVDSPIGPFSFARSIFVNTRRYSEEDLQQIIRHEFVHVKQKHTADLLVGELPCIVNWYNPCAWLIKRAIRQNLEFIADHGVLQTGLDAKQYQYLLLQVTGLSQYSVSNNFSISSLKKRIFMMNKLKSARAHLLKFLFVLPLLAVTLLAFRSQQQLNKQKAYLQRKDLGLDTVPPKPPKPPVPVVDVDLVKIVPPAPPPPPPIPRMVKSIYMEAKTNKATVVLKNGKKEVYDLTDPSQRAIYDTKYSLHPVPAPPPPVVDPNTTDVYFIDSTGNKQKMTLYRDKEKLYKTQEEMYQGKEKKYREQEDQYRKKEDEYRKKQELYRNKEKTYNDKETMYITADTVTVPAGTYALKGSLGVLPKTKSDTLKLPDGASSLKGSLGVFYKAGSPDPSAPMYVVDGVASSAADFNNINPQQIESITILKEKDATWLYGEKAVHGVVLINTKNKADVQASGKISFPIIGDINSLKNYKGLVILNGKQSSRAEVENMLASLRKEPFVYELNMVTLKGDEAVRKYGDIAKAGAVIITYRVKDQ